MILRSELARAEGLEILIAAGTQQGRQVERIASTNQNRSKAEEDNKMSDATPILHMLSPQKHMTPFDVNMAADAGLKVIVPYINVTLEEVTALTQDAIFSRPPN